MEENTLDGTGGNDWFTGTKYGVLGRRGEGGTHYYSFLSQTGCMTVKSLN